MVWKKIDNLKITGIIFIIFCCLFFGKSIIQAADINWYAKNVDGTSSLLPGTTEQLILKLEATNMGISGIDDYDLTDIIITAVGNPEKVEDIVSNTINLWRDADGEWENGSSEVCISTSTFSDTTPSTCLFSSLNSAIGGGDTRFFYITYDLKTSVTEGHTIDVDINNVTHITMDGGKVVFPEGAPLNSPGSPSYDTIKVIADRYVIDNIAVSQMAGLPFGVKIQMIDEYGNLDLDYSGGTISITGAEGGFAPGTAPDGTSPSYPPVESWQGLSDRGEKILQVVLYKKETGRKLKVNNSGFVSKDSNSFSIDAGIKLNLSLPENTPVEEVVDIRIEVNEPYSNPFVYTGTVRFTSTDAQAILPANYIFNEGEMNKVFLRGATFRTSGNQTIEVKDINDARISGSGEIIVQSGDKGHKAMNYPNPFDPHKGKTTIQFYMEQEGEVEIKIYVRTGSLVNEWEFNAMKGINTFQWDGRDKDGRVVENGTYFCLIKMGGKKKTVKISVIK